MFASNRITISICLTVATAVLEPSLWKCIRSGRVESPETRKPSLDHPSIFWYTKKRMLTLQRAGHPRKLPRSIWGAISPFSTCDVE